MGVGLLFQELDYSNVGLIHSGYASFAIPLYIVLNSAVVLHFLLVFPKVRTWRWKVLGPFYILFALIFIATEIQAALLYSFVSGQHSFSFFSIPFDIVVTIRHFLYPAMNIAGAVLVLYSYFSSHDLSERRRLRWTFLGGAIALVWQAATVNFPRLFGYDMNMDPVLAQAGLFAAPVGIAVGLVWFNTFEIDLFLSRSLAYAIVLGMVVLAYEGLTELFVNFLNHLMLGDTSFISSIIATSIVAVSFDPVKDRIQVVIDKLFFRDSEKDGSSHDRIAKSELIEVTRELGTISQLIEKHGGEIVRNDVSPDGVEFTIRLPHASAEALRVAQTES